MNDFLLFGLLLRKNWSSQDEEEYRVVFRDKDCKDAFLKSLIFLLVCLAITGVFVILTVDSLLLNFFALGLFGFNIIGVVITLYYYIRSVVTQL